VNNYNKHQLKVVPFEPKSMNADKKNMKTKIDESLKRVPERINQQRYK